MTMIPDNNGWLTALRRARGIVMALVCVCCMIPLGSVALGRGMASQTRNAARGVRVPDCAGIEAWPTSMAFVHLKNAGLTNNEKVNFGQTRTVRFASEEVRRGVFRQVHHVTFTEKSGTTIEVITVNDASNQECSEGPVDVYVISKHLGPN